MEEESITDSNNITADTFRHASNTQGENKNMIFRSEKLDKSDDLLDAVKNLTINDTKYYESNTATANDAQGNLTCNPETVTHTNNGHFEQNYWLAGPSLACPCQLTQGFTKVLCQLYCCYRRYWRLRQSKLLWAPRQPARGRPGLLIKLVGLALMEAPQAKIQYYWHHCTILPSYGWNYWNLPTLWPQCEPGVWR